MAFDSIAGNLTSQSVSGHEDVYLRDTVLGTTTMISTTATGSEAGGQIPSISADGKLIAFESGSPNILPAGQDTNGLADIFVKNMATGSVTRASVDSLGAQATGGDSEDPSVSPNGRYVAFDTAATDLVTNDSSLPNGDQNGYQDVFVHDMQAGTTWLASVDSTGSVQGNQASYVSGNGSVSDTGRVVFYSGATNLVSSGAPAWNAYVHDNGTGQTVLESTGPNGIADGGGGETTISEDGLYIVFQSFSHNLAPNTPACYDNGGACPEVYLRYMGQDLNSAGATSAVSVDSNGNPSNGRAEEPFISADDRYVVFDSDGADIAGATNGWDQVFERDIYGGTTMISVDAAGNPGGNGSSEAVVTPNGQDVAFYSRADLENVGSPFHVYLRSNLKTAIAPNQELGSCGSAVHANRPDRCWAGAANTYTGNFVTQITDAALPGIGIPFSFTRSYNSLDTSQSVMGPGWTFSYNVFLTTAWDGDVTVHAEDGQQLHFSNLGTSFAADPGVWDTLVKNPDGTYTLTRRDQVTYQFNTSGQLTAEKDQNNQGLTFAYTSNQLSTITDSVGRQIGLSYTNGLLTHLSLPDGRSVSYSYPSGLLTSVTDIRVNSIGYGYDGSNRLNAITDQNNHTTQVTYGPDGRVSVLKDPRLHSSTFSWDPTTQTETIVDNRSKTWTDSYSNGMFVSSKDPLGDIESWVYDASGNPTKVTDPGNNNGTFSITYKYDPRGNLMEEDDPAPLGYVQQWNYDSHNRLTSYTDGRSPARTTRYEYDAKGNLTCVLLANASVTTCLAAPQANKITYTYDPAGTGLLQTKTDPNNNSWNYGYDAKGNLNSITGPPTAAAPDGSHTTMTWNTKGQLATWVDPRGNLTGANPADYTWQYFYNNAGELTKVIDPLLYPTTYVYNAGGLRLSVTDANNHLTRYGYDADNNLTCVMAPDSTATTCATAPATSKTTYTYDNNNNRTGKTDGNGHKWSFSYDIANRPLTTTSPMGRTWTNSYYADSRLKKRTLPSGNVTYTYDQLNRLTGVAYSDTITPGVSFGYDANGNRTSMTDGSGSVSYVYDDLNRLSSVTRGTDVFSYTYFPGGQLQKLTYPTGLNINYVYNADNTLSTLTAGTAQTQFTYDAAGNVATKTLPNQYTATMSYDHAGRLTDVSNALGSNVLSSFHYILDGVGNPNEVDVGGANPETENFTYDALDRVRTACYPGCTGTSPNGFEYTFDPAGNVLTQIKHTPTGDTTTTYAYNADDETCWSYGGTSSNACASPPTGATSYSPDANGNTTSDGLRTFTWDLENRPHTVTLGATTHTYTYDGDGNRMSDNDGFTTTNYLWDTNNGVPQLALERGSSGNVIRRYVWAGGPISMRSSSTDYYYLTDALGSVVNVTDGGGGDQLNYLYDPFGNARAAQGGGSNPPTNLIRFTSQLDDQTTYLYDLRARMYDSAAGRMLEQDPVSQDAAQPATSSYVYAGDRPGVLADPSGASSFWGTLVGGLEHPISTLKEAITHPVSSYEAGTSIEPGWLQQVGWAMIALGAGGEAGPAGGAAESGSIDEQLAAVESHLVSISAMSDENVMMLDRIREAGLSGRALTFGEENFLLHETTEARLMSEGMSLDEAHAAALETHPLYANYDPEVIKAFPELFNSNWRNYWGIG